MEERFYEFLPSIVAITCIGLVAFGYARLSIWRFGADFRSVAWREQNQVRTGWLVGVPLINICSPTLEEVIFRAPLVAAFATPTTEAWHWILVSSLAFSIPHGFQVLLPFSLLFEARKDGTAESDDVKSEIRRIRLEMKGVVLVQRIGRVLFSFFIGLALGYYAIAYQSLWLVVGIHAVINVVGPILMLPVIYLAMLVYAIVMGLYRIACRRMSPRLI